MGFHLEYSEAAKCRPEHAWEKFSVLEQWPWWNKIIARAKWVSGKPWGKGSRFFMELARPMSFKATCVIAECEPPRRVVWVGKRLGFNGKHGFSFEPQPDGTTLIKTWEDLSGFVTIFLGARRKAMLLAMHKAWIEALKFEAERLAREEYARS